MSQDVQYFQYYEGKNYNKEKIEPFSTWVLIYLSLHTPCMQIISQNTVHILYPSQDAHFKFLCQINKLTSVIHASVPLLIMNFVITLTK